MIKNQNKFVPYAAVLNVIILVWLVIYARELTAFYLLRLALVITFSYIAMLFDIRQKCIPNKLVLSMLIAWSLLITQNLLADIQTGILLLTDGVLGLLIGGGVFLAVYLLSRKGLGGGDVKFMAAAGLYLGFSNTIPAILYGTILAALTGITLIVLGRITRKDTMPLAPFLFVGIMITLITSKGIQQ